MKLLSFLLISGPKFPSLTKLSSDFITKADPYSELTTLILLAVIEATNCTVLEI
jgi:hypothetical protein